MEAESARAKWVRMHIREWALVAKLLRVVNGQAEPWPFSIGQMLEYLDKRFVEPCGRTVIDSVLAGIAFVQKAGGVEDDERVTSL